MGDAGDCVVTGVRYLPRLSGLAGVDTANRVWVHVRTVVPSYSEPVALYHSALLSGFHSAVHPAVNSLHIISHRGHAGTHRRFQTDIGYDRRQADE